MTDAYMSGWLLKEKSKSNWLGSTNRRWFTIQQIQGNNGNELAFCYYATNSEANLKGFIFFNDIISINDTDDKFTVRCPTKQITLIAEDSLEHKKWMQSFIKLLSNRASSPSNQSTTTDSNDSSSIGYAKSSSREKEDSLLDAKIDIENKKKKTKMMKEKRSTNDENNRRQAPMVGQATSKRITSQIAQPKKQSSMHDDDDDKDDGKDYKRRTVIPVSDEPLLLPTAVQLLDLSMKKASADDVIIRRLSMKEDEEIECEPVVEISSDEEVGCNDFKRNWRERMIEEEEEDDFEIDLSLERIQLSSRSRPKESHTSKNERFFQGMYPI